MNKPTTRRGIAPHLENQTITEFIVRQHQLRWPVAADLCHALPGKIIHSVKRYCGYCQR